MREEGILEIVWIEGSRNPSDIGTKSLNAMKVQEYKGMILGQMPRNKRERESEVYDSQKRQRY